MRLVLDAMGTDRAPRVEVAGALEALQVLDEDTEIVLVGDSRAIEAALAEHGYEGGRLSVLHASERVTASDSPASVIRRKPDSSIVVGLRLLREGSGDAFVSAGSTGAVMATSLFTLGPMPGVDRPPVGTIIPTAERPCLLVDAGANVDCKPHNLVQFAHLGSTYAQDMLGREKPRVALLNIGEEPEKGDEVTSEAYKLLVADPGIEFVGNVEGRDIIRAPCDVLVCDGFVGNVLLKFYESVAAFIIGLLRRELEQMGSGAPDLDTLFRVLDYAEYGGAPLLGINGVSIICHGDSPPKAIRNALAVAAKAVKSDMVKHSMRDLTASVVEEAS